MPEITSLSIAELRRGIDSGDLAADDVVDAHHRRAAAAGPALNAFTELTGEKAGLSGPLRGIPIAVKDVFVDRDRIPTMGSRVHARMLSGTASVLVRLRGAGATILGYTNLHEWAIGTTSVVTATGPVRNPWDPSAIAGGSSGGSAAAVAAGLVPAAIGTDTGGSIRVPAACCGVVGLKPTVGVIPLDGEPAASCPLNAAGVITRSVADAALLLGLLGGGDPASAALDGLTLGIPGGFFFDDVEESVAAVVAAAAERLGASFGAVRSIPMPGVEGAAEIAARALLPLVAESVRTELASDPDAFQPATRRALERGVALGAEGEPDTAPVLSAWERAFSVCDVVAVPTLPGLPPPIESPKVSLPRGRVSADLAQIALNAPMNVAGVPALSVPCGELGGMAVGMTLVARRGADDVVLAAGAALERLLDGAFRDRVAPNGGTAG